MTRELLWVSPVSALEHRTGVVFLPWAVEGIEQVVVRLRVTAEGEYLLREAAQREGRAGWSSIALCHRLAAALKPLASMDPAQAALQHLIRRTNNTVSYEMSVGEVALLISGLEMDQQFADEQTEAEHERGHTVAIAAARGLGLTKLLEYGEQGSDIRWAVMREIAHKIGEARASHRPLFVVRSEFKKRAEPDGYALEQERDLRNLVRAFQHDKSYLQEVSIMTTGLVRLRPKKEKGVTCVGLALSVPGTHKLYALWSAEPPQLPLDAG